MDIQITVHHALALKKGPKSKGLSRKRPKIKKTFNKISYSYYLCHKTVLTSFPLCKYDGGVESRERLFYPRY